MISKCLKYLVAKSKEKISVKLLYLDKTIVRALLTINKTIGALQKRWIFIFRLELITKTMWTINILSFRSKVVAKNSFFPTNFTYLVVDWVSIILYNLQFSSQLMKLISTLLKIRNGILKVLSILISANIKSFEKFEIFLLCYLSKKMLLLFHKPQG